MTTNPTTSLSTTGPDRAFEPRMPNPALVIPDGLKGIGHLLAALAKRSVPRPSGKQAA